MKPRDMPCLNVGWQRCARKVMYRTRKEARDAAVRAGRKFGTLQKPYPCPICGGFHLETERSV